MSTHTSSTTEAEFVVDDDAKYCPHCDHPLATDHLRALHVGEQHPEAMSDTEADAFAAARDQESDDLFVFHIKVLAAITLVTFIFIYTYAFAWT